MKNARAMFFWGIFALASWYGSAQSQVLNSVGANPAAAKAGQPVTVTVNIDVISGNYCGFVVKFGDGAETDGISDVSHPGPFTFQHTYDKPGSYVLNLVGRSVQSHPNCGGDTKVGSVEVSGAAKTASATSSQCPDGWKSVKKSTNAKTGAFACSAKPGTALPAVKPVCRGDLTYYENAKKGMLGCKP